MDNAYYYEEEVVVDTASEDDRPAQSAVLTRIGRWVLVLFIFSFPFFMMPGTVSPVDMNKGYFTAIVSCVLLICFLGGALQEGRFKFVRSWILPVYGIFLLAVFISAVLSQNIFLSLVGSGAESTTFLTFLVSGILLFIIPILLNDRLWIVRAGCALLASCIVLALFFITRSIFDIRILSLSIAENRYFNPFGTWSALSAFFACMTAMLLPFVGLSRGFLKYAGIGLFCVTFLILAISNFIFGSIAIGGVALIFVALLLSRRQSNTVFFGISLALLLVVTLLILTNGIIQKEISSQIGSPTEISPSWQSTLSIVERSLSGGFLFGNGPNTFGLLWEKYKPAELNNTPFWALRFDYGTGFLPTLVAEIGLLGFAMFLIFFFLLIALVFRALGDDIAHDEILTTFLRSFSVGLFVLLFLLWVHPLNAALIFLTFIIAGLLLATVSTATGDMSWEINLFSSTERGFLGALVIIFLLIASVVGIYYESMRYMGQIVFARGIDEINTGKGYNGARNTLQKAIEYDSHQSRFLRTIAQLDVMRLDKVVKTTDVPQEELQNRFQAILSDAIDAGKRATSLGSNDPANWIALGQVYEAVIPFVADASTFAVESYTKAKDLAPSNPSIFLSLANTHLATAQAILLRANGKDVTGSAADERAKAVELLERATELKSDFAEAHFLLAQLYQAEGKTNEAIARAQATYQLVPNEVGVPFQLGLLYYQKGDLKSARVAFERAVEINANYSNAHYFLGIIYDKNSEHEKAVAAFQKVSDLNPGNEEVQKILENLSQGKPALEGIQPAPESRPDVPVSEKRNNSIPPKQ